MRTRSMQGTLKGAGGSVRALTLHPSSNTAAPSDADEAGEPLLASVGLDRFLHVHSSATRKHLGKVYCKQQMVGVEWLPPLAPATPEQEEEDGADAETAAADVRQEREADTRRQARSGVLSVHASLVVHACKSEIFNSIQFMQIRTKRAPYLMS